MTWEVRMNERFNYTVIMKQRKMRIGQGKNIWVGEKKDEIRENRDREENNKNGVPRNQDGIGENRHGDGENKDGVRGTW